MTGPRPLEARNDAKVARIVSVCAASLRDPRIPVKYRLETDEGLHPDNVTRYQRAPNIDSLARLLNYHFAFDTFAVIRKNGRASLCRVADGQNVLNGAAPLLEISE